MKEQKKNKWSILVVDSAYNAQKAQFGLVKSEIISEKSFVKL